MAGIVQAVKKSENGTALDLMLARDGVMNPWRILSDLASAAAVLGVEFTNGYKLEPDAIQISPYGNPDRVSGMVVVPSDDRPPVHVIAQQYVLALGAGFQEVEFLRERFNLRVKVEKKTSV